MHKNSGASMLRPCDCRYIVFAGRVPGAIEAVWSPHQKLVLREFRGPEAGKYVVEVNNTGYQVLIDLREDRIPHQTEMFPPEIGI